MPVISIQSSANFGGETPFLSLKGDMQFLSIRLQPVTCIYKLYRKTENLISYILVTLLMS